MKHIPPDDLYVIIPTLNEEECIASVLFNLQSEGIQHIIVVDNGSTDNTAKLAQEAGATIIKEPKRGYGKACLTGISHLPEQTKWVLFCDADGSDDLSELPKFWAKVQKHNFIIGNRRATSEGRKNLTPVQNFGNWLSGFLMRLGWGKGFSDLGPLRLISFNSLKELNMQDTNFGWTVEMQAKVLEHRITFAEVPVNYLPRQGGVSKISGNFKASARAGQIILTTLAKLWIQKNKQLFSIFGYLLMFFGALWMSLYGDPASASGIVPFFTGAGLLWGGYLLTLCQPIKTLGLLVFGATILRFILLPMSPGDDIWRYIWEGSIQTAGHNPYNTPPNDPSLIALRPSWWDNINNKDVTAIYPPLTQLIFRITATIDPSALSFKVFFILADLAIGILLWKKDQTLSTLYLLNPLILYCFAGGGHYEPLFLLPLVTAWVLWQPQRPSKKSFFIIGLLIGTSLAIKLIAIFAGCYILWQLSLSFLRHPKISHACYLSSFTLGLICVPALSFGIFSFLSGLPNQLIPANFVEDARSASFIPWFLEHYNSDPYFPLPNVLFAVILSVVLVPIFLFTKSLHSLHRRAILALLICSPMVHAWYFTWLIPFCTKGHRLMIGLLSGTAFLYFMLPYRLTTTNKWELLTSERLILWSPYLLLLAPLLKRCYKPRKVS